MKRLYRFIICTFVLMTVVFACSAESFAAPAVAKVKKVRVTSVGTNNVTLKWKKVAGATGYQIYRYNTNKKKFSYIGKTKKLKYNDTSAKIGKAYSYKVRAYKTKNKKTEMGKDSVVVKTATKPAQVKNLRVTTLGTNSVKLAWNKAKGATAYEIFVYDEVNGKFVSKGSIETNACFLKNLDSNTTYTIKISAYHNKNGKVSGAKSAGCTFTTNIPSVVGLKVTGVKADGYTMQWEKADGVIGYEVYKYNTSLKKWELVFTTDATQYTLTGAAKNTSGQYKVRAYAFRGADTVYGDYSGSVTASTLPDAPTGLTAKANEKSVTLSWTSGGAVTGYEVSRYNAANGSWMAIGNTENTVYVDDTISQTSDYTYKVRGYVDAGTMYYTDYTPSVTVFFQASEKYSNIYSQQMAEEGILGYLYDPAENCFYTSSDPFHREFGYNELYDFGAPLVAINIDTHRIKFGYNNKHWMIQLWKGQYGMVFYGAEIGVYTKPTDRNYEHYDCATDDELLKMSFDFYEFDAGLFASNKWEKKFSRPYGDYWWCTGFIPGNRIGRFDMLRMDARITMKDYEMLSAVKEALEKENMSYSTNGLNVYVSL